MTKAPSGQFVWGALPLMLVALLVSCQSTPTCSSKELDRLQGYWEGEGAGGPCSITIMGNSLHYRAGPIWYDTTFILPANTSPQQLNATINDCGPTKESVGTVVFAILKIEGGTLTLTTYGPSESPPTTFNSANLYAVKKVEPQLMLPQPPKGL